VKRSIAGALLGVLALSFAGCGGFFPKARPSRLFALSPISQSEDDPGDSRRISLGIGPIRLPGYLDRQEIMTRVAPNRFDALEYDRWAEPLDENFTQVLTQNLSVLLRTDRIVAFPWQPQDRPRYRVEVQVLRFEFNSAREAELSARWAILDGTNKQEPRFKESRFTRTAKDNSVDLSVAALSETVADLSREIVKTLIRADARQEQ
jgi:uncharacterized lipoprotein YmbA